MKAKDGKSCAEVTLRDVVENYDVSDFPMLTEIKRLYAENSMLRELENIRRAQVEHCESLTEDIEKLKAENDKLREACTDAYRAICKMYVYIDGEWNYGDAHADPTYGPILRRMRELGIEV